MAMVRLRACLLVDLVTTMIWIPSIWGGLRRFEHIHTYIPTALTGFDFIYLCILEVQWFCVHTYTDFVGILNFIYTSYP